MPDYRRAARELALRVLFQADVGRQPIRESIEGALNQLAAGVCSGLTMALRQAERRLNKPVDPPLVIVARTVKRERARVRRNVVKQLTACRDALAARVSEVLQIRPLATAEAVQEAFDDVVEAPMARLERAVGGSSLPSAELAEVRRCVDEAIRGMRTTLEKRLPTARTTADMLIRLAAGTWRNLPDLDERLSKLTGEWSLDRQPSADRNILRLAAFEILHCSETPPAVALNEAVELAKRYGTEDSPRFVNGVLSALAAQAGILTREASA